SGNGQPGTSISAAGTFTINGVPPGSYTLAAFMDPTDVGLGQGATNIVDPSGSASVNVTSANVTNANVTLVNNDPTSIPSAPQLQGVLPVSNGVVVAYKAVTNNNDTELVTSYDVAWSTSSALSSGSLASVAGTKNFKATGK